MNRVPRHATLLLIVLLGLCVSTVRSQNNPLRSQTPVLLITVDTLRADHLSCYGARQVRTPAIDALAAQGVRFRRALAQVPITPPSHAVILTGTYPMYSGLRDFNGRALPQNVGVLSEAFERHGYETAAFVSSAVLDSSWGFNRGFRTYDDHFDLRHLETNNFGAVERRAGQTIDRLLAWFRARPQPRAPFFVWLHLYDPHRPYDPPEPFRTQFAGHLYDGEIAYVDSQLNRLFDTLRASGLYDRTLIVLLSDHGEGLGEHGEEEHGFFLYNSTLHVPMIFKLPRGWAAPLVVDQTVGLIDVAPTILDLLHMQDPLSRQFQGTSLAREILGKGAVSEPPVYSETYYPRDSFGWSDLHSISTDRLEYIQAPRPELYDLDHDPRELRNLYAERASVAAGLRDELARIERTYSAPHSARAPALSPETEAKLRSLGYVAFSTPVPASAGPLPDPKDRVNVFREFLHAQTLSEAGRIDESNRILASLATEDPHLFAVPFLEAENLSRARRWSEAQRSYLASLKLNPTFERALMGLARAYIEEGQSEKARGPLELVIQQYPRNFFAVYAMGQVARRAGNKEEALRYFRTAVEARPDLGNFQQDLGMTLVDLERYAEAVGPLTRAEELGQRDPRLEHYLGTALANAGRFKEAVDHYQKALKMKPDLPATRLSLAFAYLNLGERTDAKREFNTLCQQYSSVCEPYRKQFE